MVQKTLKKPTIRQDRENHIPTFHAPVYRKEISQPCIIAKYIDRALPGSSSESSILVSDH